MRRVALVVMATAALAGCGSGGSSGASPSDGGSTAVTSIDQVEGKSFVSTSVKGRDLVAGTSLKLSFEGGRMSANAGCNTMSGGATVSGGLLKWSGHPLQTMMACGDGKDEQEKWFSGLLTNGVKAAETGDGHVVLSTDAVTIDLGPAPASS